MLSLTKYFLEFEHNELWNQGFGVTAWSEKDALNQLKTIVFKENELPRLIGIRKIKSLDELEQNHVRPNIGNFSLHGIWYPIGY